MTYKDDIEREWQEKKDKNRAEIADLCTHLERVLTNPSPHINALERQADLLDCLLYAVMRRNLNHDKEYGSFDKDGLEMTLRIQKQCLDTLKASGTVSYMQAIASLNSGVYPALTPHPLPVENDERTR